MKKPKQDALIAEMDTFAAELLAGTKNDKTTTQTRIDVFRTITQWVGVRNRISGAEEGSDLDDIRDKLKQPPEIVEGAPGKRPRGRPRADTVAGGSALAAIRRKLPRANSGDAGHDSSSAEREGAVVVSGPGGVHPDAGDDF